MDEGGILPTLDDMAWKLRISPDDLTAELQAIEQATNIVHINGNGWTVTKFSERQDADTGAERVNRYREAKRKEQQTVTNSYTPVTNHVTNAVRELELESELELKLELDTYIQACETATGYPITGTPDDLDSAAEFEKAARTTPEDAAETIIRGMEKGQHRVLIGPDAHFIDWMVRLFPVTYMKRIGLFLGGKSN
jgi:hypothetical protein